MKIKIPQSLYDEIVYFKSKLYGVYKLDYEGDVLVFNGPYGTFDIIAVPDIEYTEEITVTQRVYKQ